MGARGLTGARLALLAYLAVAGRTSGGGVGREQIASEFWPEVHSDGTLREVRSDTVKRRVWELRKVLAEVAGVEDGRELLDGTDGRYGIGDIVCDWHELRAALLLAESQVAGSERWAEAVATMQGLVRAPGLLTPPGASRARSQFSWIDHYEARVQDMTRRVVTVLTDHARILNEAGRHREALQVLGTAREMSDSYPRDVADGMVADLPRPRRSGDGRAGVRGLRGAVRRRTSGLGSGTGRRPGVLGPGSTPTSAAGPHELQPVALSRRRGRRRQRVDPRSACADGL